MDKKYHVNGMFLLEVDAESLQDAREKSERILKCGGIEGIVVQVEEVES